MYFYIIHKSLIIGLDDWLLTVEIGIKCLFFVLNLNYLFIRFYSGYIEKLIIILLNVTARWSGVCKRIDEGIFLAVL